MMVEIFTEIFSIKESDYNFRSSITLKARIIKTVMYGSETISSLELKIWYISPTELEDIVRYSKRKFENGPPKIVHVVYVKCTYKTLNF